MSNRNSGNRWSATHLGGDAALVRVVDDAVFAFGLGPPQCELDRRRRMAEVLTSFDGDCRSLTWCRQVHGAGVVAVSGAPAGATEIGDGDALVTAELGSGVLVWTADCVPVLLAGEGAVAAVHAGWRGCAADVVAEAVAALRRTAGVDTRLRAAVGPAVCGDCYRVGSEVIEALRPFGDRRLWLRDDRVDLRAFLVARLISLGVPPECIETVGGCTVESPVLASYRRDADAAGRQWALVFLTDLSTRSPARRRA